jgi:endonuclease/exonuclease/phosphatase family metal-dependent hydrolase
MPEAFKVLTYNIQRGRSAVRRRDILAEIYVLLETSGADIVCLQEVWQNDGVDEHQLEALCDQRFEHQLFAKNAVFPKGSQGNAVLSRFPVVRWRNVDISVGGLEPRGFLHVEATTPSGIPLEILCCHFGLRAAERRMQALLLQRFIATETVKEAPVILAGDFNDWRGREEAIIAEAHQFEEAMHATTGRFGKTFPSVLPMLPLDRIYYRNCRLKGARVLRRHAPARAVSDHCPVEAVFEL